MMQDSSSSSSIVAPGSPPRGIASAKIQKTKKGVAPKKKADGTKRKRAHKEGIFVCSDCSKTFQYSYLRSLHVHLCPNKVHVPVDCPDCGKQQKNKSALNLHFTNCREHKARKAADAEKNAKARKLEAARVLRERMSNNASVNEADVLKMLDEIVATASATTTKKAAPKKKKNQQQKKKKTEDSFIEEDEEEEEEEEEDEEEDISLQSLDANDEDEDSSVDLLPLGGDAADADDASDAPVSNFDDEPTSAPKMMAASSAAVLLKQKRTVFARIEPEGEEREARSAEEEEKPKPRKFKFHMSRQTPPQPQPLKRKREESDDGDVERDPEVSAIDDDADDAMEVAVQGTEAPRNLADVTRKGSDRKRFREELKDEIPPRNPAFAANTRRLQSLTTAIGKAPALLDELAKIEEIQSQASIMAVKAVHDEERLKAHVSPAIMRDAQENPSDYEGESEAEARDQIMTASELHLEYKELEKELESTKKSRDALLHDARSRTRNFKKALDPLQHDLAKARVFDQVAPENAQDCVDFLKAVRASLNLNAAASMLADMSAAVVNPTAYVCKICSDEEQSQTLVSLDACGHVVCRACSLKVQKQCPHCRATFRATHPLNFA